MLAPLPLLLLWGGLELGLRITGWQGEPDRTVSWSPEHSVPERPFFPVTEVEGVRVRGALTESQPHPWPAVKGPHTRRVFALGGSAVHGYGFTRAGSWPDKLEERLAVAWPQERVEVINLGTIAFSSQQLLMLTKELLETGEPDALVIYSGNNELLEWLGARQVLPEPALRRWVWRTTQARRLRRLRSYRLLAGWVREPGQWGQTDYREVQVPLEERARYTDADRAFAAEGFRLNLSRILELAEAHEVPVLLSTVAVNLDYRPAETGSPQPAEVDGLLREADRLLAEGDDAGARARAEEAFEAWPDPAVPFIWGQTLERMGRWEEALAWQTRALALDESPNRAQPFLNEVIRALQPTLFVDGEAVLRQAAPHGLIGFETVYDHCHPTPASHDLLAQAFAEALTELWPGEPGPAPVPVAGHVDGWLGPGEQFSLDPGTERADWWSAVQDPVTPEDWNQRGLVAWHSFTPDCEQRGTPCLQDAVEAFRRAEEGGSCVGAANLGRVLYAMQHPDADAALKRALACDPADLRSRWYARATP